MLETVLWESFLGGSLPVYVTIVSVIVSVIGIAVSDSRRVQLKKMRGILAVYPWQDHPPLKSSAAADVSHLKLPNPDDRQKGVNVVVRRYGLTGKRWRTAVTDARTQGFKFAGDPRFATVITPHGVVELGAARPAHALRPNKGTRPDGVSEAAWERATAAGITGESPFTADEMRQLQTRGK